MGFISKILYMFDNKKDREYVSAPGQFLKDYDRDFPARSASQKIEAKKHRNIFNRKAR